MFLNGNINGFFIGIGLDLFLLGNERSVCRIIDSNGNGISFWKFLKGTTEKRGPVLFI